MLTYGNRRDGSNEARLSENNGKAWGAPYKLYTTGPGDMGYPSTAQLPDGKLVTVFYAAQSPLHAGYHMGSIGWNAPAKEPVAISGRRELFLDNTIVEQLAGDAQRVFHRPVAREVVIKFDEPWEGETSGTVTVFQDGDLYRMYYRGGGDAQREEFACYAESRDGIHWTKPNLGLFEFNGSKENNIVWKGVAVGCWVPFKDENPKCPAEARYKAVGLRVTGNWDAGAVKELLPFQSADGIHWKLTSDKGIINDGYFDSQNVVFWDPNTQGYRTYYRMATQTFANMNNWGRDIMTAASPDFLHWPKGQLVQHVRKPSAQFYNNVIRPYHRAPHIYIGFPGMYDDRGAATKELLPRAQELLPDGEIRRRNVAKWQRFGPLSDTQLMWSRDGAAFELAPSTFMPPGPERPGSWTYADHVGWHLVETASVYPGAAPELTLYAQEFYYVDAVQLRRHTLRLDGFASIHAPLSGGELLTPPLIFQGASLSLNFATSAFGSLRVEVQDADGRPLPGFTLADSIELYGDTVARMAMWKDNPDLSTHASKPVRLRFVLRDADLYAMQFGRGE